MPKLQELIPAALLGLGCLMISGLREQKQMQALAPMKTVQLSVPAGYQTRDLVVPEQERQIAAMTDYVYRVFQRDTTDPGYSVYVGYYDYQVQGKAIHSPKNCLPGAGWETLSGGKHLVDVDGRTVPVNRYLLANKGVQAMVYYWYQGRGRVESSEYTVKLNLLRDAALYGRTEEALVRIVVPIDPKRMGNPIQNQAAYAAADSIATRVAKELVPNVSKVLPPSPAT
jgi:EpsI family protein